MINIDNFALTEKRLAFKEATEVISKTEAPDLGKEITASLQKGFSKVKKQEVDVTNIGGFGGNRENIQNAMITGLGIKYEHAAVITAAIKAQVVKLSEVAKIKLENNQLKLIDANGSSEAIALSEISKFATETYSSPAKLFENNLDHLKNNKFSGEYADTEMSFAIQNFFLDKTGLDSESSTIFAEAIYSYIGTPSQTKYKKINLETSNQEFVIKAEPGNYENRFKLDQLKQLFAKNDYYAEQLRITTETQSETLSLEEQIDKQLGRNMASRAREILAPLTKRSDLDTQAKKQKQLEIISDTIWSTESEKEFTPSERENIKNRILKDLYLEADAEKPKETPAEVEKAIDELSAVIHSALNPGARARDRFETQRGINAAHTAIAYRDTLKAQQEDRELTVADFVFEAEMNESITENLDEGPEFLAAVNDGRISNGYQLKGTLNELGISHNEFAEKVFDETFLELRDETLDAEEVRKLCQYSTKYKDFAEDYDSVEELFTEYNNLRTKEQRSQEEDIQLNRLTTYINSSQKLLKIFDNMEYRETSELSPESQDKISDFDVSSELAEQFNGAEEEAKLAAIIIYYYGEQMALKLGYIEYETSDSETTIKLNKVFSEDVETLKKGYEMLVDDEGAFEIDFTESVTEGLTDLFLSEPFAEIERMFYQHRIEQLAKSAEKPDDLLVKSHLRFIFNPSHGGVVDSDYRTLSDEELQWHKDNEEKTYASSYFYSSRSGRSAYIDMLDNVADRSKSKPNEIYSFAKMTEKFHQLAQQGQLYLTGNTSVNPDAERLAKLDIPDVEQTKKDLANHSIHPDYVELIRWGYLVEKQIVKSDIELKYGFEAEMAKALGPKHAEASSRWMAGLYMDISPNQREKLAAGSAVAVSIFNEDFGKYETHVIDIQVGVAAFLQVNKAIHDLGAANQVGFFLMPQYQNLESGTKITVGGGLTLGFIPSLRTGISQQVSEEGYYIAGGLNKVYGAPIGFDLGGGLDLNAEDIHREKLEYAKNGITEEMMKQFRDAETIDQQYEIAIKLPFIANIVNSDRVNKIYEGNEQQQKQLAVNMFSMWQKQVRNALLDNRMDDLGNFGWEVGLAFTPISPIPIPYFSATFHNEKVVSYSLQNSPDHISDLQRIAIEKALAKKTGVRSSNLVSVESGDVVFEKNELKVIHRTPIPEVNNLFGNSTELLHQKLSKFGLHVSDFPADSELSDAGLPDDAGKWRDAGYKLFELDTDTFPGTQINFVFDPALKDVLGVHPITQGPTPSGKIQLAINPNGTRNLNIFNVRHTPASGTPYTNFYFTNQDVTPDMIDTNADVISYNRGAVTVNNLNNSVIDNDPRNLGTAKELTDLDGKITAAEQIEKSIIADAQEYAALKPVERQKIETSVLSAFKKNRALLIKFAKLSAAGNRSRWQNNQYKKAIDILQQTYKKETGKDLTGAALAYAFEVTVQETFMNIDYIDRNVMKRYGNDPDKIPQKIKDRIIASRRRELKNNIRGLTGSFVRQSLNKNPHLAEKFTATERKQIEAEIVSKFNEAIDNPSNENGLLGFPVGREPLPGDLYYASTAAYTAMGNGAMGFRYGGLNENTEANPVANYINGSKHEFAPNSLTGRFLFELLDAVDTTEGNEEKLFNSRLATKLLGAPLGKFNGKNLYLVSELINLYHDQAPADRGAEYTRILGELARLPQKEITAKMGDPVYKTAVEAFKKMVTDVRAKQMAGESLEFNMSNGMKVELKFRTELSQFLMGKCGNGSFGLRQDFYLEYYAEGELMAVGIQTDNGYEVEPTNTEFGVGGLFGIKYKHSSRPDRSNPKKPIANPATNTNSGGIPGENGGYR